MEKYEISSIINALCKLSLFPVILVIIYVNGLILIGTFKICLIIYIIISVIIPVIFMFSWTIQRNMLFLNFVNYPRNVDYSSPEKYGLLGAKNVYVKTDDNVKIGVWQLLPNNLINSSLDKDASYFDEALNNGQPVIVYMHGNSNNRAASHRVELYSLLRKFFHVFTFDYRSYGDSTYVEPNEAGLVNDSKYIVEWVKKKTTSPIFVWGHSLGTGVSSHVLDILSTEENIEVNGLILECPFNNLRDEICAHPFTKLFNYLPWFEMTMVNPYIANGAVFNTEEHILNFKAPVLILHAEDDGIVPFNLGYKLYKHALKARKDYQGSVYFQRFDAKFNYGHKWICRAPELSQVVLDFVKLHVDNASLDVLNYMTYN